MPNDQHRVARDGTICGDALHQRTSVHIGVVILASHVVAATRVATTCGAAVVIAVDSTSIRVAGTCRRVAAHIDDSPTSVACACICS